MNCLVFGFLLFALLINRTGFFTLDNLERTKEGPESQLIIRRSRLRNIWPHSGRFQQALMCAQCFIVKQGMAPGAADTLLTQEARNQ